MYDYRRPDQVPLRDKYLYVYTRTSMARTSTNRVRDRRPNNYPRPEKTDAPSTSTTRDETGKTVYDYARCCGKYLFMTRTSTTTTRTTTTGTPTAATDVNNYFPLLSGYFLSERERLLPLRLEPPRNARFEGITPRRDPWMFACCVV